jgi:rSAM/selenodomain-associated transferase 2
MLRVSVIIPFLNEEKALPDTLSRLFAQSGEFEVIAVDAGSVDGSRAALARHPRVRVLDAQRGRAQQMNAGARSAGGEVLLFLHADTLLPQGAMAELQELAHRRSQFWGGFHHRFSRADWRLDLVSRLHNFRCRKSGVFYGDQAMFVSRELFWSVGGFPLQLMEDIAISEALLRLLPPTFLPETVVADSRKFVQMGVWRSLGRVLLILGCREIGLPVPRAFFRNVR